MLHRFMLPTTRSVRLALALRLRALHGDVREMHRASRCDYMVVSRAKSGRTWLRATLSRLYQQHFDLPANQLLEYDNFHRQDARAATVHFSHGHFLRRRLAEPKWETRLASKRLVFLVRHPLDVVVSEYFQSTRRATGHKRELLKIRQDVSMFEFAMESAVGLPATIDYLNMWAPILDRLGNATLLRYEDMRARPVEIVASLVEFLGAPFSLPEIREAVEFTSFENLKRLEQEDFFRNKRLQARDPADPDSFKVRRGKVGGFADYFDEAQTAQMTRMIDERLAPIYGYGKESARRDQSRSQEPALSS